MIDRSGQQFLVMEYAPHGSLRDLHPKGFPVTRDKAVSYVKQVISALQYINDQKFIRRDVKPENMLLGSHNNVLPAKHHDNELAVRAEGN